MFFRKTIINQMNLADITLPIQNELPILEKRIDDLFHSDISLVNDTVFHINGQKGKRLRSSLMFLIGKLLGEIDDKLIDYAVSVETLHTATLIHADVVDEATERRGISSINAK